MDKVPSVDPDAYILLQSWAGIDKDPASRTRLNAGPYRRE